ncbi:MAG TPA: hypothetical protein VF469_01860 [Kofleriaceae bacterium]
MVLLGLSALAYASEPAPGDAGAVKTMASPIEEDSDFLAAPADMTSCLDACAESYHFCLSASEDAVSDCACFDATVGCQSACGADGGAPVQC